jgi:branched-chain amino acid transport system ATP-binding protein
MIGSDRDSRPILEVVNVAASYEKSQVLRNVTLSVPHSSVVALIGANGAGKSTLLRVVSGLMGPDEGHVILDGRPADRMSPHERARAGLCLIPEGRGIFRSLSVRENLELQIPPWISKVDLSPALAAFPPLKPRLSQVAGSLSGGEQQMLALSRAYLSDPKLILLDEVSLGLAPIVVDQIFSSLAELAARSVALLIVEQYVNRVLELADTVYLLTRGEITWTGTASSVDRETVMVSYLSGGTKDGP